MKDVISEKFQHVSVPRLSPGGVHVELGPVIMTTIIVIIIVIITTITVIIIIIYHLSTTVLSLANSLNSLADSMSFASSTSKASFRCCAESRAV